MTDAQFQAMKANLKAEVMAEIEAALPADPQAQLKADYKAQADLYEEMGISEEQFLRTEAINAGDAKLVVGGEHKADAVPELDSKNSLDPDYRPSTEEMSSDLMSACRSARGNAIFALCDQAGMPDLYATFITAQMTLTDVREALVDGLAAERRLETATAN